MKNILVPTDFSENALKASEYAAGLATRCGAAIHLVHAYVLLEGKPGESQSMRDVFNKSQIEKRKGALLHHQQFISEKFPSITIEYRLFTGSTDEVLMHYNMKHDIDLVVMGTKGASGIAGVLLGSVTASFIEKSKIPVLAVPSEYAASQPENILLAIQYFEQDKRLLDIVFELASLFDVPVHVFAYESDNSEHAIAERTLKLNQYLSFLQRNYPLARLSSSLHVGSAFEEAIEDFGSENKTGIICMISHKRSILGKVFNPSLTKRMAYNTKIPLLAITVNN